FGESIFGDFILVVNTLPPPEKVQQLVRIGPQSSVSQTAKRFVVEVLVDPVNLTAGRLFDNPIRASHVVVGGLVSHAEDHHCAASSIDWNWCASPPWTKKLLGSWPSGSKTRRAVMPRCRRLRERSCAACWPLPLTSASKTI